MQIRLDTAQLRELVAPLYHNVDVVSRWDYGERLARDALRWIDAADGDARDADADMVAALAHLYPVRTQIYPQLRTRTALEAFFVGQGWTTLRTRELMRGLEHLPDQPRSLEEKLVADAETLSRLGIYGFARAVALGPSAQQGLAQCVEALRKQLHRRLYTRLAQVESGPLRAELRDAIVALEKTLEPAR